MYEKFTDSKSFVWLGWMSAINFNLAVMILLAVTLLTAAGNPLFLDNNTDLYGPLAGNLPLMLVYLTLSQFAAYCFCSYSENYRPLLPIGLFWLTLVGAIKIYGAVNEVPIDEDYGYLFIYLGFSNLVYGGMMQFCFRQEQDAD